MRRVPRPRLCGMLLAAVLFAPSCRTLDAGVPSQSETTLTAAAAALPPGVRQGFVYSQNGRLWLNAKPYYFAATNSYPMLKSKAATDQAFAAAQRLGLNAIRFWAFGNGEAPQRRGDYLLYNDHPDSWPPRLDFPEERWRQLDYILKRAADHQIRLIMPLSNFWDDGIDMIARWTGEAPRSADLRQREVFYNSERARTIYKQFVDHLTTRVNTLTGIAYKDDPMILMYEPMNEPRGRSDPSGRTVSAWLDWAGSIIKAKDGNHLVGSGTEGFMVDFQPTVPFPDLSYDQPPFRANQRFNVSRYNPETRETERSVMVPEGVYFPDDCNLPHIDLCSLHAWPYNWSVQEDAQQPNFIAAYIRAHREVLDQRGIKKPLYLGEFGRQVVREQPDGLPLRDRVFKAAYAEALRARIDGMGYWHMGFGRSEEYKGLSFDILCDPNGDTDSTCAIIKDHARQLAALGTSEGAPSAATGQVGGNPEGDDRYCPAGIDTSAKTLCNANDPQWYCLKYNGRWCVVR